jgi:predicted PhzF superfamily epimerase YddE/YHI9
MGLTIYQVDAFTDKPFSGNPAAVCILDELADESWMQGVAQEMNLSETAFLHKQIEGYDLRWFTPAVEVELCGHATLASAHILWEVGLLEPVEQAIFHTLSGPLLAHQRGKWIEMDFPATKEEEAKAPDGLIEALVVEVKYIGKNQFDYLVEVESESVVRTIKPNIGLLETVAARGIIVTSLADSSEYDFVSRFFAPNAGVNEDPVTGSAHCCLSPFWSKRLGKDELVGYQASARGGVVKVRYAGDRVILGGQAVTILRGELFA